MSERPIVRCYECPNFRKRRGSETKGRCEELKKAVDSVDWCYRDQVTALKLKPLQVFCAECNKISEMQGSAAITVSNRKLTEVIFRLECGHNVHIVCKFDVPALRDWLQVHEA